MSPLVAFIAGSLMTLVIIGVIAWELMRWTFRPSTAVHIINGYLEAFATKAHGITVHDHEGKPRLVPFAELQRAFSTLIRPPPEATPHPPSDSFEPRTRT